MEKEITVITYRYMYISIYSVYQIIYKYVIHRNPVILAELKYKAAYIYKHPRQYWTYI